MPNDHDDTPSETPDAKKRRAEERSPSLPDFEFPVGGTTDQKIRATFDMMLILYQGEGARQRADESRAAEVRVLATELRGLASEMRGVGGRVNSLEKRHGRPFAIVAGVCMGIALACAVASGLAACRIQSVVREPVNFQTRP